MSNNQPEFDDEAIDRGLVVGMLEGAMINMSETISLFRQLHPLNDDPTLEKPAVTSRFDFDRFENSLFALLYKVMRGCAKAEVTAQIEKLRNMLDNLENELLPPLIDFNPENSRLN